MIGDSSGDTFEVEQKGTKVIVNRIRPSSWGMILMFECCKGEIISQVTLIQNEN